MNNNYYYNNTKSATDFTLCVTLLVAVVSATHPQQHPQQQHSRGLQKKETQKQVLVNGRPRLIEPSPCIAPEVIRAIHEDLNDPRLPWLGGGIQTECYALPNHCGSNDRTATSACCRIQFDVGWLVCDALNGFDWMPCVCNDNTDGSPTPEPSQAPTTSESGKPSLTPSLAPTQSPSDAPIIITDAPSSNPSFRPTVPPTNNPTLQPIVKETATPTNDPTNPPSQKPTAHPSNVPTSNPTRALTAPPVLLVSSVTPTTPPTNSPTEVPIVPLTVPPSSGPTYKPSAQPTDKPSLPPTAADTAASLTTSPPIATSAPSAKPVEPVAAPITANPSTNPQTKAPTAATNAVPATVPQTSALVINVDPPSNSPIAPTPPKVVAPVNAPTVLVTTSHPSTTFSPTTTFSPSITSAPSTDNEEGSNYRIDYRFDDELATTTIVQSQCNSPPPVLEFVQESNFLYQYEVVRLADEVGNPIATIDNDNDYIYAFVSQGAEAEDIFQAFWTNEIHTKLSEEFMVCNYNEQKDTVWILQSKAHTVDKSISCTQGISSFFEGSNSNIGSDGGTDDNDNDDANESSSNDSNNDTNQSTNTCVVMKAEVRIVVYESLLKRKTNRQLAAADVEYASGSAADAYAQAAINFLNERMNAGDFDRDGLIVSFDDGEIITVDDDNNNNDNSSVNEIAVVDTGTTDENENKDDTVIATTTNTDCDDINTNTNTAAGIEDSNKSNIINSDERKSMLTPPILATIVVASAFIILLLLVGISRRRHNNKQQRADEEDEEYLREIDAAGGGGDADSLAYAMATSHHNRDLSSDSESLRAEINDSGRQIVRSQLDLEDNNTVQKDYYHDASGGSSNGSSSFVVRSPSRTPSSRQRPENALSSLDELYSYASSNRTAQESESHRGGRKNNNNDPRSYQLHDTVNL